MSLAIGAASYAMQRIASLFSDLTSPTVSNDTSTSSAMSTADASASSPTTPAPDNSLTGSTQPSLSSQILATLMQLQGASGQTTGSTGSTDPMQNLFNAMDTDGNGSVSQSEMESYVEKAGGSQSQADTLFGALDPNGSASGVTEGQMASAMPQSGSVSHHHHHHHAGGASASTDPTDPLMSLLDGNQDGSVSQTEFSSFVTSNGGTAAQANSDFAALDSGNTGSLSSADFATAWQNIQNQPGGGSSVNAILDAFARANNSAATVAASSVTA